MKFPRLIIITSIALMLVSCESLLPIEQEIPPFDREQMLTHWADNIIVPSLEKFSEKAQYLSSAGDNFINTPTDSTLTEIRTAWYEAYLSWQRIGMFCFIGKAAEISFSNSMNKFPVDTEKIENNIVTGNPYIRSNAAIGFPAIEYMLYGLGETDELILEYYTSGLNVAGYLAYLKDLIDYMNTLTVEVLTDWQGAYRNTFISRTENSEGGSIFNMVNDFTFFLDLEFKFRKMGAPLGMYSNTPMLHFIEAPFKGDVAKKFAQESLDALQDFFNGTYEHGSGPSIASYLDHYKVMKEKANLSDVINAQFDACRRGLSKLDDDFRKQINDDPQTMKAVFDEITQLLVLLQTDMMPAMDVYIDYIDSD